MSRRRVRRAGQAVVLLALVGGLGSGSGPAAADAPISHGWWTVTNQSDALPVTPPDLPVAVPPDVPADGLLVQGGPTEDAPTAYAALAYDLDPGSTAQRLVLTVAPNSATNPQATLKICALKDSGFSGEQGGPMADAPAYDCARSATASPSGDGLTYRFDAGKVADGTTVAVAVLPTTAADRVVLVRPGSSSLTATGGTGGSAAPPAYDPSSAPAPAGGTGTANPPPLQSGGSIAAPPAMGSSDVPGPSVASPAAAPAVAAPQQPAAIPVVPVASQGSGHGTRTAIVLIAALALAAVLWSIAGGSATARA